MATRSRGIGRSGRRPGSGRPKGAKSKDTVLRSEILPRLEAADQELPLYGLLRRIADDTLDPRYRDVLRIAVLPYMHPKAPATLLAKPPYLMSDAELIEVARAQEDHEQQVALGRGQLRVVKKGR